MILIIENAPMSPHQVAVDTMFADRKALFVDLFGWDVPVVDGRFEIDQFDGEHVVYLVAVDGDGAHEASLRLLPTERPHMLDTLFRNLCPLGVPTGPTIWESTRLCLPQRHGAARRRQLRNALISAMVDFALARGITRYTGILPEPFRKEVLAMGWLAEPLGPAVRIPGGPVGAFAAHIAPDTPDRLRWTCIYTEQLGRAA
ncbi:acyl-homoserine-lactone synthase [Rhizorhabdus dicambivorans]|uniref:Acyl-homoserine-lactone synthase n=2 Tax=Rhizorhabdus dicambivorans TaxID=1850238 RepID=A0A2A4FP31_9SPHN|nr:acyl-homoserine-lactone synthase [Rhizorhabdus dicambivorans]ATE67466.1 autoinducer synthase [Rhizorhabdus dicambivorans]PCE40163.1 autoinducer synthase [Rhizorhabdus dicambivorans]